MSKKRAIAFLLYSASTHLQVEPRARLFFPPFIHSLPNCSDRLFTFLSPLLQALNLLLSASAELSFLFLANSYQEFHLELPINSAPIPAVQMNKAAAKTGKQTAKINKSENYVTRCNSSKHNQERGGGGEARQSQTQSQSAKTIRQREPERKEGIQQRDAPRAHLHELWA